MGVEDPEGVDIPLTSPCRPSYQSTSSLPFPFFSPPDLVGIWLSRPCITTWPLRLELEGLETLDGCAYRGMGGGNHQRKVEVAGLDRNVGAEDREHPVVAAAAEVVVVREEVDVVREEVEVVREEVDGDDRGIREVVDESRMVQKMEDARWDLQTTD